eukprot:160257-Hanusia_phi.AAC.2
MAGSGIVNRVAASLLVCAGESSLPVVTLRLTATGGMEQTLVRSVSEYVALAVRAAENGGKLAKEWRRRLVLTRWKTRLLDRYCINP